MQLGKVFKENRLVSSPDWFSLFNPHFIHRCKKTNSRSNSQKCTQVFFNKNIFLNRIFFIYKEFLCFNTITSASTLGANHNKGLRTRYPAIMKKSVQHIQILYVTIPWKYSLIGRKITAMRILHVLPKAVV